MNILPYQIHNILKIYREPAARTVSNDQPPSSGGETLEPDRVEISGEGRKEQIKREIVAEIIRKIR
ncbi:MAG: hypothetical protein GXP58_08020 [Deltaproteobacteria bacterium]|nr:hypothetical protein [Deltaproteobacteria bacterium]